MGTNSLPAEVPSDSSESVDIEFSVNDTFL